MRITMLGTGVAVVKNCYNTCFVIEDNQQYLLVDAGGGSQIFTQLDKARIDWRHIHDIFVTHKHIDHIMGVIWMIRLYCQNMASGMYEGEVRIYGHDEVIAILKTMAELLLIPGHTRFIGDKVQLITVEDGEQRDIIAHRCTFFDMHSPKAKQYGFVMQLNETDRLACCGDEPYNPQNECYVKNSKWLLHEAFCLDAQKELFHPYEKRHSTVKDACLWADKLGVENLLLYHTEEQNLARRKELYVKEGRQYFKGTIVVPDDLETVEL